jgi:mono/diheme cytochrome c family protein
MAATDQTYRNQRILDIVFAASCVLMLVAIIGMFSQDFFQEWKHDQNTFNDADEAMDLLAALHDQPSKEEVDQAEARVKEEREKLQTEEKKKELKDARDLVDEKRPARVKTEATYNDVKATYDSKVSLYNIAMEERDTSRAQQLRQEVDVLGKQLQDALHDFEKAKTEYDDAQANLAQLEKPLTDAADRLKQLNKRMDAFLKSASLKREGVGYWIRSMPVIDAFARPTRIKQYVLDDLTIDYGTFRRVPRWDRCTTCHLGIEKPSFTRENLRSLADISPETQQKLDDVRELAERRKKILAAAGEKIDFDPSDLKLKPVQLVGKSGDEKYLNEFCVHPRLDLFVDSNSPHKAEKFGCTICHSGQGSSTEFNLASHTPDTLEIKKRWQKDRDWESNHFWDYPMLPKRFVESTCIKCHHQVTDLIREGTRVEAPKVVRGYNLIRENGCFGCHEISGFKGGRSIGPDLRLEPSPPLEALPPSERDKLLADPTNPPGTMRKVGPSLRRLSEKTNLNWVRQWINSPRGFRPDTKMPHFYNLSNNHPDVLPDDQKGFPQVEIDAIASYLMTRSGEYLDEVDKANKEKKEKPDLVAAQQQEYNALLAKPELTQEDKKKVDKLGRDLQLEATPPRIEELATLKDYKPDAKRGGRLFRERGCLACHTHKVASEGSDGLPAVHSVAHFGPNLSRLAAKLGDPSDPKKARVWLTHWIKDPKVHHPRTFMPVTFLEDQQAADIAEWLLKNSEPDFQVETNPELNAWKYEPPTGDAAIDNLRRLARVHLEKAHKRQDVDDLFNPTDAAATERADKWLTELSGESDEKVLAGDRKGVELDRKLKLFVGKKAIGQLGCYGCHDIPGFETAKPIGTPLNDWGKKDPERLAFEDIDNYVKHHFDGIAKSEQKYVPGKEDGQSVVYDRYFYAALEHHQREGFLYQKLAEPRSFDYERRRAWDERLRMPQFKFNRDPVEVQAGETPEQANLRAEGEAREAVMTFVLGLVAEPVSSKYVYDPPRDKLAEIKGRQVLDKFNCAGCHLLRPGTYDLNTNDPLVGKSLQDGYRSIQASLVSDHRFPNHNAWVGPPQTEADVKAGRLVARGVSRFGPDPDDDEGKRRLLYLTLTEALHIPPKLRDNAAGSDLPAPTTLGLPEDKLSSVLLAHSDSLGGTFGNLLVDYLIAQDKSKPEAERFYKDIDAARPAVPPMLLREGEKVQPVWLYQFLLNPIEIRPMARLRMPKFNMSPAEAQALVNYFAAVDQMTNPGIDLTYPYETIPQRDEGHWKKENQRYVAGLKDAMIEERQKALEPLWKAELQQRQPKDPDKEQAEWRKEWRDDGVYATDAYRLLANYNTCLGCHRVGSLLPSNLAAQGPPLYLANERLRPGWTERWIANPKRFWYLSNNSPMPQNYPADGKDRKTFEGTPIEQVRAVRDVLMDYPRIHDMPANRGYRPKVEPAGGK